MLFRVPMAYFVWYTEWPKPHCVCLTPLCLAIYHYQVDGSFLYSRGCVSSLGLYFLPV